MAALFETHLTKLGPMRRGKVRDVYDLGDRLLIVATDRLSAFDVVLPTPIPGKGRILNQISAFWFGRLGDLCPHHLIGADDEAIRREVPEAGDLGGRGCLARKATPLPVECIVRGYLAGSLFKEYRAAGGQIHGLSLPDGLRDGDRLPEPLFTPSTKAASGHDENISWADAVDLVGRDVAEFVRNASLAIYREASAHAESAGLILADTKFEFGLTDEGPIWIDEALTPDSSRYWEATRWSPGGPLPSFDKQFVRDYLETLDWDKKPPGPELPATVVDQTLSKYLEAYRRLTGEALPA